jgi:hypothetical protein
MTIFTTLQPFDLCATAFYFTDVDVSECEGLLWIYRNCVRREWASCRAAI